MLYIDLDPLAARSRWASTVKELNAAQPVKTVRRKLTDGSIQTVLTRPKAVSGNVRATGERLISCYIGEMKGIYKRAGELAFDKGLPGLAINCVTLGQKRSISDRTARTHLSKLRAAGLISRYEWHGTRADFEVWISPEILWGKALLEANLAENSTEKPVFLSSKVTNLPLNNVTVTHSNKEIEIMKGTPVVDNTATSQGDTQQSDNIQGYTERQHPVAPDNAPTASPEPPCHSDTTGGWGRRRAYQKPSQAEMEAKKRVMLEANLLAFWTYAKVLLYPGRSFTEVENNLTISEIRRSQYRNFAPNLTQKEWDNYQEQLYKRLQMVAHYYTKHPDKYTPEPYSRYIEGTGYFAIENKRGFEATAQWYKDQQQLYRTAYVNQRLNLAIRHLHLHAAGKSPAYLRDKDRLGAFKLVETRLAKYGQKVMDRFYAIVAKMPNNPKIHK